MKLITTTMTQLKPILVANVQVGLPTLLYGHPGIGKTTIAEQVYTLFGEYFAAFYVWSTTNRNAIDLGGLYRVNAEGKTERCPVDCLVLDKPVFILIDELGDCPSFEQSGYYRALNEKEIGDKKLFAGSYVMAATNRPEDNAAAMELSNALKNRCMNINLVADTKSVLAYAVKAGWSDTLRGFIAAYGNEVIERGFTPESPYGGCTPRGLDFVHRLESAGMLSANADILERQIIGCIDHDAGSKYLAFRQLKIPSPQLVYDDAKNAPRLDGAMQFAYQAAIVGQATSKEVKAIISYALLLNRVDGASLVWELRNKFGKSEVEKHATWIDVLTKFYDLF